jgi:hypothetical protein
MEQPTLFDLPDESPIPDGRADRKNRTDGKNPMLLAFGPGPENATCGHCKHMEGYQQAATWYKCALRKNTGGRKTDHKVRWPACGKFEEDD